ncbi:DEAD/DEAH box helicase family protein [Gluconobacter cerinus]|uniref:DEAD/DEAH box helicase family protein n=1 Tax=Gluconobacter cerinus TaxID=38307 RepID=UPI001B8AC4AA|nr:DEAD/DEAH box helicase family protein [Gluconobacter cerinus]MBS0984329.1 DEAD/DEAH box helicase family protein [Gluconobacter cerinus]
MFKNQRVLIPLGGDSIKVINAVCGAGKSFTAKSMIKRFQTENKYQFIIVAKTVSLCQQWHDELSLINKNVVFYHSGNTVSPVFTFQNEFKNNTTINAIFIMTEACFELLLATNSIPKKNKKVIHDEFMKPYDIISLDCPQSHELITQGISVTEYEEGTYRLSSKNNSLLEKYQNSNDAAYNVFKPLATAILQSHNFKCDVNKKDWDAYVSNVQKGKEKLEIFVFKNDTMYHGFNDFFLLGALFETTLIKQVFSDTTFHDITYGFIFQKPTKTHDGSKIQVCYLFNNYSRTFIETKTTSGNRVWDELVKEINITFDNKVLVYINNHKRNERINSGFNENFIIESPNVIGINSYKYIKTSVYLASTNPTNIAVSYFAKKGITREQIEKSVSRYNMYQALMRDASRDQQNQDIVVWVVPTESDAIWIHNLLVDAPPIEKLEINIKTDRRIKFDDPEIARKVTDIQNKERKRWKKLEPKPDTFMFTENVFNTGKQEVNISQDDFIAGWIEHTAQGETHVINAQFNKQRTKKIDFDKLTRENHQYSNGLFLDIDNDGLKDDEMTTYQDVINALPEGTKLAFRNTMTCGNFHVFIPTKQKLSYEAYKVVQRVIISKIGCDPATQKATQKIHFDKGQVGSYVHEGSYLDVDIIYRTNEAREIIYKQIIQEEKRDDDVENMAKKTNYESAKKSCDKFNSISDKEKHNAIYGLVKDLRHKAHMTENEIEMFCSQNCPYFFGSSERLKKLRNIK